MKEVFGWVMRGGRYTRAALDDHAAAIRDLQVKVEEFGSATGPALAEQLRAVTDDLGDRIAAISTRLDSLDARLTDMEVAVDEVVRVIAPAAPER